MNPSAGDEVSEFAHARRTNFRNNSRGRDDEVENSRSSISLWILLSGVPNCQPRLPGVYSVNSVDLRQLVLQYSVWVREVKDAGYIRETQISQQERTLRVRRVDKVMQEWVELERASRDIHELRRVKR